MSLDMTAGTAATPAERAAARTGAARALLGAGNAAVILAVSWALWFVLLDPNGVLKLYTPMYGFSLVAVLVAVVVAIARVGEGWPFHADGGSRSLRGAALTLAAVAVTGAVVHGWFWGFLGRYGVTYFSPRAIIAAGGVGAEFFNARENASTAIVYFTTAFLWASIAVPAGFGRWPWTGTTVGVRAFSRLAVVTLAAVVAYATLFHPHVTQLFYPAQTFAGVPPWWSGVAQTASAYFNLGWVLTTVSVLVCAEVLWDGWPWRAGDAEGGPVRGVAALLGSAIAGLAVFWVALRGMTWAWGDAFQGGQYTDAPYFRYLHAGELAGFLVLSAFALDTWFARPRTLAGRAAWTLLALLATAALHVFYYSSLADRMLGKVAGYGQPEDTPLVWTLLVLALVLVQREFLARRRAEGVA